LARSASFKLDITRWVEKAGARADLVVRKVALDMLTKIVMKTPVDTGRARGHWGVGVTSITYGAGLDKGGGGTIAKATASLQGARAGDRIYIANNLPYIVRLEYGHSKQAPAGMVRTTIDEFQSAVNRAAAEAQKERP
jgi:hypothetical protein